MKNKIVLTLVFLLILTLLTSCIASGKTEESSGESTSEESEISESELTQTIYYEKIFDCFKDKSVAELEEMFNKNNVTSYGYSKIAMTNTPTCVIFSYNYKEKGYTAICSYNKQSGIITYACPDPLCDHIDCVYGDNYMNSVYTGGYIYTVYDSSYNTGTTGEGENVTLYTIYRTDADGNNAEKLYEFDNVSLMSGFEGSLYFMSTKMDENNKAIYGLTKIDKSGEMKYVSPEGLSIAEYKVNEDGIYYVVESDYSLYLTADEFTTSQKLIENICNITVADGHLFYKKIDKKGLYRSSIDGTGEILISESIGEFTYNNSYIYYVSGDNCNEMRRIKSDGTGDELMFVSETNGEPDEFDWYLIDGTLCYAYCSTCVDEAEAEKNNSGKQIHFVVYDMTTGEKFLIDPDF